MNDKPRLASSGTEGTAFFRTEGAYDSDSLVYWATVYVLKLDGTQEPLPIPTVAALKQHASRFGSDCVEETATEYGIELDGISVGKPSALQLRIRQAHRLHKEHVPTPEIASRMNISLPTVRKYLAVPDAKHATKPSKTRSRALSIATQGKPSLTRKQALKERVRALRDEGFVRAVIAERLGKTDATVSRYLAELRRDEAA